MTRTLYKLWLILLILSGAVATWFVSIVLIDLNDYARLDRETPAQISEWKVIEISSSRFALAAFYQYEVDGIPYKGRMEFSSPPYLNRFAAENQMKSWKNKEWSAWYQASSPAFSSLRKEFPKKPALHALLTLGVFIYFFFARSQLAKFA
ncbi:MAG: hypothetical protein JSS61_02750 [Verrucomicrobia bacterium]|nr:hypothetical protein [Verrucomicrobiota bacterium]